jgi:hypothetical protein
MSTGIIEIMAQRSGVDLDQIAPCTHPGLPKPLRGFIASRYVEFDAADGKASVSPGELLIEADGGVLIRGLFTEGWQIHLAGQEPTAPEPAAAPPAATPAKKKPRVTEKKAPETPAAAIDMDALAGAFEDDDGKDT